jgi:L-threonylcarbamoyladenylate synthase
LKTEIIPANDLDALTKAALSRALEILRSGGLVAFPTDTVYGLGALVSEPRSIENLYEVKGRDAAKAIPILIGDPSELTQVAAEVSPTVRRLAARFWPGPLTLVVPRRRDLPEILSPLPTVGVRMPDHPAALALIRHTGPLAVTSANLSRQLSASTAQEVLAQLEGRIPLILDGGRTPGGVASTVVDCTKEPLEILRPGPVSLEELLSSLS